MQGDVWEREYQRPQLVTKAEEPQKDTLRFFKSLKKAGIGISGLHILDIGSGTGRNANYLASLGNTVVGLEISKTALSLGIARAKEIGVKVDYRLHDIGSIYPFADNTFDVVIDVTSSNSLNEKEREIYLPEVFRIVKPGGHFFVKALCKDGDQNAKNLIKNFPGREHDTYINKDMGLTERVFTEQDFRNIYSKYFKIESLEKKTSYTRFNSRSYKRNFWLAHLFKRM